jgi:hypothetical protein
VVSGYGTQVFPRILSTVEGVVLRRTSIKIVKKLVDAEVLARRLLSSASEVAAPVAGAAGR